MQNFNFDLSNYTPPVLRELADYVHEFARQLDCLANDNEMRLNERRNTSQHKRTVRAASEYFCKLVEDGMATEKALDLATAQYCVRPEAVKMTVSLFKAKQRKIEKLKRDRLIMLKYRAGLSVAAIARKVGCTPATVNRVIAEFQKI